MQVDIEVVKVLIEKQFPQWQYMSIRPLEKSGHDNRTFYLGDRMTIRLPSAQHYVPQVEKEFKWLPFLQKKLTLPIPCPIVKGVPDERYPYPWTVNNYIEGEVVDCDNVVSRNSFAIELAAFLKNLQTIDTTDAPLAGKHNFYRGGNLLVYHEETISSLNSLKDVLPVEKLNDIWQCAISSKWDKDPVWLHGDVAVGNLLVMNGHLCGVIDFGIMGVGDPACDYVMAWNFFDKESRNIFLDNLSSDTINRAKGWALWKALITFKSDKNASIIIKRILNDNCAV